MTARARQEFYPALLVCVVDDLLREGEGECEELEPALHSLAASQPEARRMVLQYMAESVGKEPVDGEWGLRVRGRMIVCVRKRVCVRVRATILRRQVVRRAAICSLGAAIQNGGAGSRRRRRGCDPGFDGGGSSVYICSGGDAGLDCDRTAAAGAA